MKGYENRVNAQTSLQSGRQQVPGKKQKIRSTKNRKTDQNTHYIWLHSYAPGRSPEYSLACCQTILF